jgi:hypothetical protein
MPKALRSDVGRARHANEVSVIQIWKSFAIPWNANCVRPSHTRLTFRNLTVVYTHRRHRASESAHILEPGCFILTFSLFDRSSIHSDDNSMQKMMLLTDVFFGEQISLARDEIPPAGVEGYDTVRVYRVSLYSRSFSLSFSSSFSVRYKLSRGHPADQVQRWMM